MPAPYPSSGPVTLRANLKDYPLTLALKSGKISSPLVTFEFCGPQKVFEGFKPMVRERAYDVGEMALATFLHAKLYGKPLTLLPACIVGKFQHNTLFYMNRGRVRAPQEITGSTAIVRSYTQTTAVWARGILQHEYGVDLSTVKWLTADDPHLSEFHDPPNCIRVNSKAKILEQRLIDGEADFGIVGLPPPTHPDIRRLLPDPETEAAAWGRKYGCAQINHMFVVDSDLAKARPDVVAEIFRLLAASKEAAGLNGKAVDPLPFGVTNVARSVELMNQYAFQQQLIPRPFSLDELFEDSVRDLKA